MNDTYYQPHLELLKPYFSGDSKVDSKTKAFAFLIGVLFGKLINEQPSGDDTLRTRTFSMLKRFSLSGKDLQKLYLKLSKALLDCTGENSELVEAVQNETKHLALSLGTDIELDENATNYFILLGVSVSNEIFSGGQIKGRDLEEL